MFAIFENIRLAFMGLSANKLRSALTMLGITIGVAAVIVLVSVGQAVESFVLDQFSSIGTNLLVVIGVPDANGRLTRLTQSEADALADPFRVPDAIAVMPQLNLTRTVLYEGREARATIQGVTPAYTQIVNRTVVVGRFFDQNEYDSLGRVALIGRTVIENLFPDTYPIGQSIRISGVRFTVIGILNERGGGGGLGPPGSDADNIILVPLPTAQTRLSGERNLSGARPVSLILVQSRDAESVNTAARQVRQTLREERNISFRDEDNFTIFTQADLLESLGSVTGLLTVFLGLIAGISLVVGGIGIMNIMLVTVTERTREIGLRKAVGAQKGDILWQFLTEATVLALVGGALGVGLATGGLAAVRAALPTLLIGVQLSSVLLATVISLAIGIFFGIYPASRAASLNPIDALRYE
ncbi:MAG: ABC transporter permease [Chloroflexi bacterium]|nr:ABC transporter permease [Chloroflexota bacterium]